MEEQWNVIYVDRISRRELTSRTLDSREAALLHASDLNRNHDEVLRITRPDGAALVLPFARLQLAFEVDLRPLLAILLGDLAEVFVESHDIMPFGALLANGG
jgi:hypothetical protein